MTTPYLFGQYCLLERVSVGGMAEVFRAKPLNAPEFTGYLALKRILPHLAEDDEFIMMFVDEAKLTVQLNHPNIVRIYELGQFQQSYYILMEFIAGKDLLTLQKRVRKRREVIGVERSVYIAREMARGLDYAHHRTDPQGAPLNIIHRDISPQNVLVDYLGNIKVIDFGIAKAAVQSTRTQVGVLKGKMGYMSPEQVSGKALDKRSDIFAIGTVLWEMLTNKRLFNAENEFETMQLVRGAKVDLPSVVNPEVPPELDAIVMKALTADLDARYPTAGAFADALDGFLATHPCSGDDLSVWMREVFADDLGEELAKRDQFSGIVTAEDVRKASNLPDKAAAPEPEETYEKTEIWAGEYPAAEPDPMEFAAQHTVVQAGGFNIDEYLAQQRGVPMPATPFGQPPMSPGMHPGPMGSMDPRQSGQYAPMDPRQSGQFMSMDPRQSGQYAPMDPRQSGQYAPMQYGGFAGGQAGMSANTDFRGEGTQPGIKTRGGARTVGMFAAVFVAVVLVVAVVALAVQRFGSGAGGAGTVLITAVPATAQVTLNGAPFACAMPCRIENLGPGKHFIEIGDQGYDASKHEVVIEPGKTIPIDAILKKAGPPTGKVEPDFPDFPVRVFVDGEERGAEELEPSFDLTLGEHLVEVVADGYKPFKAFVDVTDRPQKLDVRMGETGFEVDVRGDENAVVRVNGERVGVVPTKVRLDLTRLNEIEVTLRTTGVKSWKSAVGLPNVGKGPIDVRFSSPPKPLKDTDFGYMRASTGKDWYVIWIDGVDTGLTTLESGRKIPVEVGAHTVSFRRGYDSHDVKVDIKAGETTDVLKNIPFKWMP